MYEPQYGRQRPVDHSTYVHSRTRTTSSNFFPLTVPTQYPGPALQMHHVSQSSQRRSPSVNTFSTVSSGGGGAPGAYWTSPTNDIRRSTSGRSGVSLCSPQPASYVALLRKKKATVWCERAQQVDSGSLASQRAAKARASREIEGTTSGMNLVPASGYGRTATGLSSAGGKVVGKIRHHGKPAAVAYSPDNNYVGVGGVPMRLSATEVEGGDHEEDEIPAQRLHHRRTGSSGRSSTKSGRRLGYRSSSGLGPSNSGRRWSPDDTPERTGSLVEDKMAELELGEEDTASGKARSFGSGSSAERLDTLPDLDSNARLAINSHMNATAAREKTTGVDDLKRRGSVDERTMTLTTGRLYIANPD